MNIVMLLEFYMMSSFTIMHLIVCLAAFQIFIMQTNLIFHSTTYIIAAASEICCMSQFQSYMCLKFSFHHKFHSYKFKNVYFSVCC